MHANRAWWIPAEDGGPEREYVWPYINSELGFKLFYGGNQKDIQLQRIREHGCAVIFLDPSVKNLDFLDQFPPRSICVFQVSDETYSTITTIRLLRKDSLSVLYRDYPTRNLKFIAKWPRGSFLLLVNALRMKLSVKLFMRAAVAGIIITSRQLIMQITSKALAKKIKNLPLGYTGIFSEEYRRKFNVEKKESLIDFALNNSGILNPFNSNSQVFFMGQRGNFDRQLMIEQAVKAQIHIEKIYSRFGGADEAGGQFQAASLFVEGLLRSEFSMCPPGNYSAESFRFLESLLLWSFPLQPPFVLSDPLFRNSFSINWNNYLKGHGPGSVDSIWRENSIRSALINLKAMLQQLATELGLDSENREDQN
jgi:hypothetical protein